MFYMVLKHSTKKSLKDLKIPRRKIKQEKGFEKHFCIKGISVFFFQLLLLLLFKFCKNFLLWEFVKCCFNKSKTFL